jgi:hypothetical protein
MLFFLSFSFPQIYIKNKLLVSETFEPPENFELQLNPSHGYFVEVAMQRTIFPCDLELNLKLDGSPFIKFHFIRTRSSRGSSGLNSLYSLIPVDFDAGGFFEIEVINSVEIVYVVYKIYQDVPENIANLIDNSAGLAFLFVAIIALCICYNKDELQSI